MDLGGQLGITHTLTNYPGLPAVTGPDLARLPLEQAYMYGLERLIGEQVEDISVNGRAKTMSWRPAKTSRPGA